MTAFRTELLTLQTVRLAGFAEEEALAERSRRPFGEVHSDLHRCAEAGDVERMSFAETSGWILSSRGSARLAALLAAEVDAAGASAVLGAALEAFEDINGDFVETVSRWQLRSMDYGGPGMATAGSAEYAALLTYLSTLGEQLQRLLAPVAEILPRFGRYPAQYLRGLERARSDGLPSITGIGILSCHVVWAELHQDLLSTLGRDRTPEPHAPESHGQEG